MKNKMTLVEFKNYIKKEAEKLFQIAILKEEKERIEFELSILKESTPPLALGVALADPETLKQVRQEMLKKAAGWAVPEPIEMLSEKKYSDKASNFIGKEIGHLQHDKGYNHERAVAASINIAKDKGYKIPSPTNEIDKSAMQAAKKDIQNAGDKFEPLGKNNFETDIDKNKLQKAMSPEQTNESAPSAGLSSTEKSNIVKKAKAGEDIGHKGKGFKDVATKAAKEYGSKEAGEKVAAAAMWKNQAK